jgi:RNA polymerase sigma-70 factor, ECF subfamily
MTHERDDHAAADFGALRAEIARAVRDVCPASIAAQAEDLAHQVLIRLIERRELEGNLLRPPSYWRKAAYHAVVDELRRVRRRREESLDHEGVHHEPATGGMPSPERQASSNQLGEAIAACVGELSEPRRLPVVLFLQGHSVPAAAALLGWDLKRAESGLYRGLRDLRSCLAGKGWNR